MSSSGMPKERHYFCYEASQTETSRPLTRIIPPDKHPLKLIFIRITENHHIDVTYDGIIILVSQSKLNAHRNWSRYFTQMLNVLTAMRVPQAEQPILSRRIFRDCALLCTAAVLPITVIIAEVTVRLSRGTTVDRHQVESLDRIFDRVRDAMERVTRQPMETYKPKLIPATISSIQSLEKVKLDEATSFTCAICKEGLDLDHLDVVQAQDHGKPRTNTTRLPCLHIYHENCIVHWLKISHLCPLCRYAMPIVEEGEPSNAA